MGSGCKEWEKRQATPPSMVLSSRQRKSKGKALEKGFSVSPSLVTQLMSHYENESIGVRASAGFRNRSLSSRSATE
jgi:hypothetical protein